MIEDYLSILDSLITIAGLLDGQIDKKIEEIPTDFTDGSIPFANSGFLIEDNSKLFWDYVNKRLLVAPDTDVNCTFGRLKVGYMDDVTFADVAYLAHYDHFAWNTFALAQAPSGTTYLNGNGSVNFHDKMLTYGRYYNSGGIDKRWHISGGLGDPVAFCIGGRFGSERIFLRQVGTNPTQLNVSTPYSNLQFNVDGRIGIGTTTPTARLHLPAGTTAAGTAALKMDEGALLTTQEPGTFAYSGGKLYFTNVLKRKVIDRTSDVTLTTVTVANTIIETVLWTGPMAANSLRAGNVFKFHADGLVSNNGAAAVDEVTIRIRVGGIAGGIVATLNPNVKALTGVMWHLDANATQRTIGAGGSRAVHMHLVIGDPISTGDEVNVEGIAAIDTTANMDVVVTAQWASAKAANTISLYQGFMEYKN